MNPDTPPSQHSVFAVWRWKWWVLVVVVVAIVLACWIATYASLADRVWGMSKDPTTGEAVSAPPEVLYPALYNLPAGLRELIELSLAPIHRMDRLLRPEYWSAHFEDEVKAHDAPGK
jgi:hypothetical protein